MMAATIQVFCAGAAKSAVVDLVPGFEKQSGHTLQFTYGTAGNLQARIEAGGPADMVIASFPAIEKLMQQNKLLKDTMADIGQVGVGIAVHQQMALPDVSTVDALRESLLSARSVAYGDPSKGDSSGVHFTHVLERLGIALEMSAKSVFAPLGLAVAEYVEQGKVELGATQASVILANKGVKLAGLLPASLQHITTYSLAVVAGSAAEQSARQFAAYLDTPVAKANFKAAGFE
jgi:molybdate transport system substrate-binding protein